MQATPKFVTNLIVKDDDFQKPYVRFHPPRNKRKNIQKEQTIY